MLVSTQSVPFAEIIHHHTLETGKPKKLNIKPENYLSRNRPYFFIPSAVKKNPQMPLDCVSLRCECARREKVPCAAKSRLNRAVGAYRGTARGHRSLVPPSMPKCPSTAELVCPRRPRTLDPRFPLPLSLDASGLHAGIGNYLQPLC